MHWLSKIEFAIFGGFSLGFVLFAMLIKTYASRYSSSFTRTVGNELGRAFVFISPMRLLVLNSGLILVVSVAALLIFRSPIPALIFALGMAVLPRLVLHRLRNKRLQVFRQQMPDLIALVAGGIRAGASMNGALGEVASQMPAPAGQEISLVLRESRMGCSLDAAIAGLERRLPTEETVLFVSALRIGGQSGGSIASTLDALADAIRRKLILEGKIKALTAQGRMQAWVMGLLPFVVLAAMLALDQTLVAAYFGSLLGWALLGSVVVLQLIGAYLIRQMINIEI